jgi:tetratricopeptide (TPR) repeat protein
VRMSYDRDWQGAGELFQKALAVMPNYATVNHWYGDFLFAQERVSEAIQYYDRALRNDPLFPVLSLSRGWAAMTLRRFDEAIAYYRTALELDSTLVDAHTHLARSLLYQGKTVPAIDSLEKAVTRSGRRPLELAFLGNAYGLNGQSEDAQQVLRELNRRVVREYISPLCQAIVYMGTGDRDRAFEWLERARKENDPWLTENSSDLVFEPLRSDPRWQALKKRLGLAASGR